MLLDYKMTYSYNYRYSARLRNNCIISCMQSSGLHSLTCRASAGKRPLHFLSKKLIHDFWHCYCAAFVIGGHSLREGISVLAIPDPNASKLRSETETVYCQTFQLRKTELNIWHSKEGGCSGDEGSVQQRQLLLMRDWEMWSVCITISKSLMGLNIQYVAFTICCTRTDFSLDLVETWTHPGLLCFFANTYCAVSLIHVTGGKQTRGPNTYHSTRNHQGNL